MPPEENYLAVLTRYLTIVRDLPEAEFAKAFRDRIQLLNATELRDAYWLAFEPSNMAADHLVVVLRAMARSCAALGEDLAAATLPPLSRIIKNMEQASPFRLLLQAVEETLTPR